MTALVKQNSIENFTVTKDRGKAGLRALFSFGRSRSSTVLNIQIDWDNLSLHKKTKDNVRAVIEAGTKQGASVSDRDKAVNLAQKLANTKTKDGKSPVTIKEQRVKFRVRFVDLFRDLFKAKSLNELEDGVLSILNDRKGESHEAVALGGSPFYSDGESLWFLSVDLVELENRYFERAAAGDISAESSAAWLEEAKSKLKKVLEQDFDWKNVSPEKAEEERDRRTTAAVDKLREIFPDLENGKKIVHTEKVADLKLGNELSLVTADFSTDIKSNETKLREAVEKADRDAYVAISTIDTAAKDFAKTRGGVALEAGLILIHPAGLTPKQKKTFPKDVADLIEEHGSGILPLNACDNLVKKYKDALVDNIDETDATAEQIASINRVKSLGEEVFTLSIKDLDKEDLRKVGTGQKLLELITGESIFRNGLDAVSFSIPEGKEIEDLIREKKLPSNFEEEIQKRIRGEAFEDKFPTIGAYLSHLASSNKWAINKAQSQKLNFEQVSGLPLIRNITEAEAEKREKALARNGGEKASDGRYAPAGLEVYSASSKRLAEFAEINLKRVAKVSGLKGANKPQFMTELEGLIEREDFSVKELAKIRKAIKAAVESNQISVLEASELENLVFLLENGYVTESNLPRPYRRNIRYDDIENLSVTDDHMVSLYIRAKAKVVKDYYSAHILNKCLSFNSSGSEHEKDFKKFIREIAKLAEDQVFNGSDINYLASKKLAEEIRERCNKSLEDMIVDLGNGIPDEVKTELRNLREQVLELARCIELAGVGLVPAKKSGNYLSMLVNSVQFVRARTVDELKKASFDKDQAEKYKNLVLQYLTDSSVKDITGSRVIKTTGVPVRHIERVLRAVNLSYNMAELSDRDYNVLDDILSKLLPKPITKFKVLREDDGKTFSDIKKEVDKALAKTLKNQKVENTRFQKFIEKVRDRLKSTSDTEMNNALRQLIIEVCTSKASYLEVSEIEIRELINLLERLLAYGGDLAELDVEKLVIKVKGQQKPLIYKYPTDKSFREKHPVAYANIKRIQDLADRNMDTAALNELNKSKYLFAGIVHREFEAEWHKRVEEQGLFVFINEIGHIETWQLHPSILNNRLEYSELLWEVESHLDFGNYDTARELLLKPTDKNINRFDIQEGDYKKKAERVNYYAPNQTVVKRSDGQCETVSFDGPAFGLTSEQRLKINSVKDLEEKTGNEYLDKKRESYVMCQKLLINALKEGDYFAAMKQIQDIQKSYNKGDRGQWLVRISKPMSAEEGRHIIRTQMNSALSQVGDHQMLKKDGEDDDLKKTRKIIFPYSKEMERELTFSLAELENDENATEVRKALNKLLWELESLDPMHEELRIQDLWGDIKELFDGYQKFGASQPVDRVRSSVTQLRYSTAQAFFDIYELNRLEKGMLSPHENLDILEHVKQLRKLSFNREEYRKFKKGNYDFNAELELLFEEFEDNAGRWARLEEEARIREEKKVDGWRKQFLEDSMEDLDGDEEDEKVQDSEKYKEDKKGAVGILRDFYTRIRGHKTIDASGWESVEIPESAKEEFKQMAEHQPERKNAFEDVYKKIGNLFKDKLDSGLECEINYTHEQGFILTFESGRHLTKLKVGDRLSTSEDVLTNAETAFNLARQSDAAILGGKNGRFEPKSAIGRWISGERQQLTYEKGVFELLLERESPAFDEIKTFPNDSYLLLEVRNAAKHFLNNIHAGENSRDFAFSKRQVKLMRQDLLKLRWNPKVCKSAKDKEAVKQMLELCEEMSKYTSFRQKAREVRMTENLDVPKQAGIYNRTKAHKKANKKRPISALEAETVLTDLAAVYGTESNPKEVGPYITYFKYVPRRGPRVVCVPKKRRTLPPRGKTSFAINLGQPASGMAKWLRHADLAYNALQKDDFYMKRTDICKREFKGLLKLFSLKEVKKKLFGVKFDVEKGTKEKLGLFQEIVKAFKDKPISTLLSAPFVEFNFIVSSLCHRYPLHLLQIVDKALGTILAPWARAEMSKDSLIWHIVSNGDNGMGLMEVNNFDFRDIQMMGNEAFIKVEMNNSRFINCGLSGTAWMWSQLHNVSFKMHGGLTGFIERIPFLNLLLWPSKNPDHRVQARAMKMMGIKVTGFLSFANRADMRGTDFKRAFNVGFTMRGSWLGGIETDEMTRWGFMFPPGYEALRRGFPVPLLSQLILLPIYRHLTYMWYLEGSYRGEGDKWQGLSDPEKILEKMYGKTEWGSQWSMQEYLDFVKYLKDSAAFKRSIRTRVPTFLQQYVAGVEDYVVIDNEGSEIKFLVTWDGGANNRVLAFIDKPEFWEEASKRIKAPRYLRQQLEVSGSSKWTVLELEKMFAHIATVNRENPFQEPGDMPELVREFYAKSDSLDEATKYNMEKAREAAGLRHGGGTGVTKDG